MTTDERQMLATIANSARRVSGLLVGAFVGAMVCLVPALLTLGAAAILIPVGATVGGLIGVCTGPRFTVGATPAKRMVAPDLTSAPKPEPKAVESQYSKSWNRCEECGGWINRDRYPDATTCLACVRAAR